MKSIQPVNKYHLSLIDPRDKSCCRQSLTISAINYTDRASTFLELSTFDERYVCRGEICVSLELGKSSRGKYPYFVDSLPEFP